MNKFCSNCGAELKEGADICLKCGVLINKGTSTTKVKVPGKGSAIAGMVLGIVSVVWAFLSLLSLEDLEYELRYLYRISEFIGAGIGATLFSLAPSIVGLCLSISSIKKQKCGKNVAGMIMNIIALVISVIVFITVLTYCK